MYRITVLFPLLIIYSLKPGLLFRRSWLGGTCIYITVRAESLGNARRVKINLNAFEITETTDRKAS